MPTQYVFLFLLSLTLFETNVLLQSVTPDSLNRLVACTADDSQIIAICGETKLDNEEGSWWTMVQVRNKHYSQLGVRSYRWNFRYTNTMCLITWQKPSSPFSAR